MVETAWTPSPWAISPHDGEGLMVMGDRNAITVADCGLSAVATRGQQAANARLIAAAPSLHAACAAAEDFIAAIDSDAARQVYAQLHAALARARGETL